MEKESKIYVAGHRGLVGSAIVKKLQEQGYDNLLLKASWELDLKSQKDVDNFFQSERPEYVFLAAAKVGGILANDTYKADFIYDNLMIAANVIRAAHMYGTKKLLNLGSSCIYPKFAPQPMKEEHFLTGTLEPTNEPYAIAKIAAIKLCRYFNEQYNTNFISVMPTNLYGPNDNFNLEASHVLAALVRKFHLAKRLKEGKWEEVLQDIRRFPLGFGLDAMIDKKGSSLVEEVLAQLGICGDYVMLWGTGTPCREFLYVDDLAEACVYLVENFDYKDINEFVNIGAGEDITILKLAYLIKEIVDFGGEIKLDTTKPDGTPRKLLDVTRIKKLGWQPKVTLNEGIRKTYDWYLRGERENSIRT